MMRILSILLFTAGLSACGMLDCKEYAEVNAYIDEVEILTTSGAEKKASQEAFIPALKYDYHLNTGKLVVHKTEFLEFKTRDDLLQFINYKKGDSILVKYCLRRPTETKVVRE